MLTPLERAQVRVSEELAKLELATRIKILMPYELKIEPWIIAKKYKTNEVYITFRVPSLAHVKELLKYLHYKPLWMRGAIRLEIGYPCGSYTKNTYVWYWEAPNGETIQINVDCAETVARVTADKKIKYYYQPGFKVEHEKFNMNENYKGHIDYWSGERSEYPPSYTIMWEAGFLPFN